MPLNLTSYAGELSFAEAQSFTYPLILLTIGIVVYSVFIFKFYRFLAKKNVFQLRLQQYKKRFAAIENFFSFILYIIEYIIIMPLFVFFWFLVIAVILSAIAKDQTPYTILFIAMGIIAATRATAYYNEELSRDLAKMLPFVLLGIFVVDATYFSYENFISTVSQFPALWETILYYLGFTMLLETVLRILSALASPFRKKKAEKN
ncbi:hypothetical protein JXB11_04480 [Candidatus Woesearchaeota archaeon]|nr:hypothetical protein [Candidatus Woesearchaeota archaeon]